MSTFLGCIADDFTGATDLAGLLARSGAPVSLRIGIPTEPPNNTAPFEVIALKIRTSERDEAIEEALAAQRWLSRAGAQRFFWKYCSTFDSTASGNIGPVSEALMNATQADQTTYCPAFPENGRAIFMGNLFVGEQPLAESPMKDHPLTPMRDSNLMRLLAPQVSGNVGLVNRLAVARGAKTVRDSLDQLKAKKIRHVIMDAVADSDLSVIASACRHDPLITGGSAVAMPLPDLYAADGLLNWKDGMAQQNPPEAQTLVLSGSCSSMTNAQVSHYINLGAASYKLDPLELADNGTKPVLEWLAAQNLSSAPLIYATADPESVKAVQKKLGTAAAGELVESVLAECAVVARDAGARRFIVAGGETSGAVTKALGVTTLDIGAEIAPGVPWTYCTSNGERLAITLKSGNFGTEEFFSYAPKILGQT